MIKFKDPWGYSKLETFESCPQKFKFQFIDKLPQPDSPAMKRGSDMHANIESFLNGWVPVLSPDNQRFSAKLVELRDSKPITEQSIGLSKDWSLLPNWFHKDTWLRAKADAMLLVGDQLTVIDFKSGKFRVPSQDQIELYAIVGHAINQTIAKVDAEYWYLDVGAVHKVTYTSSELVGLRKKFETRAEALYQTVSWNPKPSAECRWCPYSRTKGGTCAF